MTQQMFEYTISGSVKEVEGELYLLPLEGTALKVKQAPREIDFSVKGWQVIPNTSSDGGNRFNQCPKELASQRQLKAVP